MRRCKIAQSIFPQRALIARGLAREESAGHPVDAFDRTIDPGSFCFPRSAIDPKPRLAVIEPGESQGRPR